MTQFHHIPLFVLLLIASISQKYLCTSIINPSKVKTISWKPRAYVYQGFLTEEECNHLISLAKSELKRSAVADNLSGKSVLSEVRTSSGMFIPKGSYCCWHRRKDCYVDFLTERSGERRFLNIPMVSFLLLFLDIENGEDIQVLRYEHGQKYEPHYDYFADKDNIAHGGHRLATVLMYLSDVEKGGETVFPSAEESPRLRSVSTDKDLSDCGKQGPAVKPRKGDALLFFSLHTNAIPDPTSLHAGCPVDLGEKWSATKWIHVDSFDKIVGPAGNCTDGHESCGKWASLGECNNNPDYMIGSSGLPGYCRKSCNVC